MGDGLADRLRNRLLRRSCGSFRFGSGFRDDGGFRRQGYAVIPGVVLRLLGDDVALGVDNDRLPGFPREPDRFGGDDLFGHAPIPLDGVRRLSPGRRRRRHALSKRNYFLALPLASGAAASAAGAALAAAMRAFLAALRAAFLRLMSSSMSMRESGSSAGLGMML